MDLRLETLGGLRVTSDGGKLVDLPGQTLRSALLVYLAVERRVERERLAELFWPTRTPNRARRALSQMLYELRQKLGSEWIDIQSDSLVATERLGTDAKDLADTLKRGHADQATHMYRGPFLRSFHLPEAPEFERWVDEKRTHFANLYRRAQSANIDYLVGVGDVAGAVAAARRWVLAHPLEDDAQLRLIGLLARSGLRNEALRQYADYAERLRAIDLEPLESVTELVESLHKGTLEVEVPEELGPKVGGQLQAKTGVVVFPFLNLSADPTKQYFCDGLAEEIMHVLDRMSGLRVVPRTSAFTFRHPDARLEEAVKELGVTHALEGSVHFTDDRYRIRISLIKGSDEEKIWKDQFEGRLDTSDVFELQDQIANQVFLALGHRLELKEAGPTATQPPSRSWGTASGHTVRPEAHALYLRGREFWFRRTLPDLARALDLFVQAAGEDPDYARAYAGIADVYLVLGGLDYATHPPGELYPRALMATQAALERDPELAQGHAALGNYFLNHAWDWDSAGESFRRAIDLNPGYSSGRQWYSNYLMSMGQEDEAIAQATLALELDPRSVFLSSSLARLYQLMRRPERAAEQFQDALRLDPTFVSARIGFALARLQSGSVDTALNLIRATSEAIDRDVPLLMSLDVYARAVSGDKDTARKLVQRLKATSASYLPPEYVGLAYVGLGDHDRALDWLEKAFEAGSSAMTLLRSEPLFDPLRGSPRFDKLNDDVKGGNPHVEPTASTELDPTFWTLPS